MAEEIADDERGGSLPRSRRGPGDGLLKVQLLTFPDCPHAEAAREMLLFVLESSRAAAEIEEVDTTSPETPEHLRGWGSPTILIDGADIEGQQAPSAEGCRLYRDSAGQLAAAPPEATLRAAIARARARAT